MKPISWTYSEENVAIKFWCRFEIDRLTGCWFWKGRFSNAYGVLNISHKKSIKAHRLSYELFKGAIPVGMTIDHLCQNPSCVNPDHLEVVTQSENTLRGNGVRALADWKVINRSEMLIQAKKASLIAAEKQRAKTHCVHGHEYSPDNTYIVNGMRRCKACCKNRYYAAKSKA